MMRVPQSHDDFCRHLKDQVAFLRNSCKSYDAGFFGEARRLATVIRVLLHDTKKSTSLLESLGIKQALHYYDRYAGRESSGKIFFGVGVTFTPKGLKYIASLNEPKLTSEFSTWWDGIAIKQGTTIHRRCDIILAIADMDGGAHVDPGLEAQYSKLSREYASIWHVQIGQNIGTVENGPELPIVRQCAFDLELTLSRQVPALLGIDLD
jgi:hypothetical protein